MFLHAAGGADGGVEGGVGLAEAVGARVFEGAAELAQGLDGGGNAGVRRATGGISKGQYWTCVQYGTRF